MNKDQLENVQRYYDEATPLYVQHLGTTFQAALLSSQEDPEARVRASNLALAAAAGIQPGDHVLDAGCGVCGPSIDIASAIEGVVIDAVTISAVQCEMGWRNVREAGLSGRVRVVRADYHVLPFADNSFDKVIFFESAGYTDHTALLFSEVFRVLRPGGRVYIKDIFRLEKALTAVEQEQLALFDQVYAFCTPKMSSTWRALQGAGLQPATWRQLDVAEGVDWRPFNEAMWSPGDGAQKNLNDFGKAHYQEYQGQLPVYCAEITAVKQDYAQLLLNVSSRSAAGSANQTKDTGLDNVLSVSLDKEKRV